MAKKKVAPQKKTPTKRQFTRYLPDPGSIALILTDGKGKKLEAPIPCLIVEESYGGCGLMAMKNSFVKKDMQFEVQVGRLSKMKGQVRWTKILEDKIIYFGIEYLE